MYRKILVPLDGSELAEQVLPLVIELAACAESQIILLRVRDLAIYETMMTTADFNLQVREQAQQESLDYLSRMSAELRRRGLRVRTIVAQEGAVYSTILNTAKEQGVDLIAMSTHGRSGLARLVMGSVADDVVRHADLPVILVRPQPVRSVGPLHRESTQPSLPTQ